MGREPLSVALAVNGDLVAGVGQPVEGAAREDRVVEQAEPLFDIAVGRNHEAGCTVTGDGQFVEVDRLLVVEPVQAEVVEDQEIGREEAAEGLVDGAVDAGLGHIAEAAVGGCEADRVSGAHGGVTERLGEEALAHSDRTDEQHVLAAVEELQRAGGVEQPAVERDLGGPVDVFQPADLFEAGPATWCASIAPAAGGRGG